MKLFVISALVFGIALLGMSVGVIFGNRRIRGSCGGVSGLRDAQGNPLCEGCSNQGAECSGEGKGRAAAI
jgi:hypothetical protein